jgi:hypothetical protein
MMNPILNRIEHTTKQTLSSIYLFNIVRNEY